MFGAGACARYLMLMFVPGLVPDLKPDATVFVIAYAKGKPGARVCARVHDRG